MAAEIPVRELATFPIPITLQHFHETSTNPRTGTLSLKTQGEENLYTVHSEDILNRITLLRSTIASGSSNDYLKSDLLLRSALLRMSSDQRLMNGLPRVTEGWLVETASLAVAFLGYRTSGYTINEEHVKEIMRRIIKEQKLLRIKLIEDINAKKSDKTTSLAA